jgi:hypothetical protein
MNRDTIPWEEIARYIDHAKLTLGLTDWRVVVNPELPDKETSAADNFIPKARKFSMIRFADSFFELYTPEERRATIYHELMHCWFSPMWQAFTQIQEHLPPAVWALYRDVIDLFEETLCDAIAEAVAPQVAPPLKLKVPRPKRQVRQVAPDDRIVPSRTPGSGAETPPG